MITGVMSGGRNNNHPVVVELYAISDVANLNIYNVGIELIQNADQQYYRYPHYRDSYYRGPNYMYHN